MPKRLFTLIEMLVVIAIISILASMLLPSLQTAMRTARTVACTNNTKQLGVITANYASDSNGKFYPYMYLNYSGGGTAFWPGLLASSGLIPSAEALFCPDFTNEKKSNLIATSSSSTINPASVDWAYIDYGYNAYNIGSSRRNGHSSYDSSSAMPYGSPATTSQVKRPSKTIVITDTVYAGGNTNRGRYIVSETMPGAGAALTIGAVMTRHSAKASVLWADLHATTEFGAGQMDAGGDLSTMPDPYLMDPFSKSTDNYWNRD